MNGKPDCLQNSILLYDEAVSIKQAEARFYFLMLCGFQEILLMCLALEEVREYVNV